MDANDLTTYAWDDTDPPFLLIRNVRGAKDANSAEFERIVRAKMARKQPFITLHDARWSPPWLAADRKRLHDFMAAEAHAIRELVVSHIVLVRDSESRGMVDAIFWGSKFHGEVFTSVSEAKLWGRERYEKFLARRASRP